MSDGLELDGAAAVGLALSSELRARVFRLARTMRDRVRVRDADATYLPVVDVVLEQEVARRASAIFVGTEHSSVSSWIAQQRRLARDVDANAEQQDEHERLFQL